MALRQTAQGVLRRSSPIPAVRDTVLVSLAQLCRLRCPGEENFLVQFLSDDNVWLPMLTAIGKVLDAETARPLRLHLTAKLDDEHCDVRLAAVEACIPLLVDNEELSQRLLLWLGAEGERDFRSGVDEREVRRTLAATYAILAQRNGALLDRIISMLNVYSWPTRIDLALTALDYATQPWYGLSFKEAQVREQAARILGQLDPLYQDEKIFTRLVRVLTEDTNAEVRDAAYGALWRLAAAPAQTGSDIK